MGSVVRDTNYRKVIMKCYAKNCEQTVTAFCILDDSVACEAHVVGDYFRNIAEEIEYIGGQA